MIFICGGLDLSSAYVMNYRKSTMSEDSLTILKFDTLGKGMQGHSGPIVGCFS